MIVSTKSSHLIEEILLRLDQGNKIICFHLIGCQKKIFFHFFHNVVVLFYSFLFEFYILRLFEMIYLYRN